MENHFHFFPSRNLDSIFLLSCFGHFSVILLTFEDGIKKRRRAMKKWGGRRRRK
jgi:hypothetical protein